MFKGRHRVLTVAQPLGPFGQQQATDIGASGDPAVSHSPRRHVFDPRPIHPGFAMEKLALVQTFLQVLGSFPYQYNSAIAL